ncbi:MAG: DUF4142 domain-containing protein [Acidobacteriota bacterium]|nr:DUF4142 domain-containing protein [Acidobacteriota bacterium]
MSKGMKIRFLLISVCIFAVFAAACTGDQPKNMGTANSEPIVKTDPPKAPSDKGDEVATGGATALMNAAAAGNMAEVELGKLAVEKAENPEVKAFGQKMIDDHSKAFEELKKVAELKKTPLPPDILPTQKEAKEKLSKLSGAEFDKEYVKTMVEVHKKDVTAFEAATKTVGDADVKAFAEKTLPTLKMHLEMIQGIAEKMNIETKP